MLEQETDIALIDGERSWSSNDVDRLTARAANALAEDGLGVGDRVAILGRNSAEWLLVYFGSTRAGTVDGSRVGPTCGRREASAAA